MNVKCRICKCEISMPEWLRNSGLCDDCSRIQAWKRKPMVAVSYTERDEIKIFGWRSGLEMRVNRSIAENNAKVARMHDVAPGDDPHEIPSMYFRLICDVYSIDIFPVECRNGYLYGKIAIKDSCNILLPGESEERFPLCDIKRIEFRHTFENYQAPFQREHGYKGLMVGNYMLTGASDFRFRLGEEYETEELNPYIYEYSECYFHYCYRMEQVLNWRDYITSAVNEEKSGYRYGLFEIEASGHCFKRSYCNGVANHMKIIREIPRKEIIEYFNNHPEYLKQYNIKPEVWSLYCK